MNEEKIRAYAQQFDTIASAVMDDLTTPTDGPPLVDFVSEDLWQDQHAELRAFLLSFVAKHGEVSAREYVLLTSGNVP